MRLSLLALLGLLTLAPGPLCADETVRFDDHFVDATLRVDYYHVGAATGEQLTLDQLYRQDGWAGSRVHLQDLFNNGRYYVKVFDPQSQALLYSKGFDSYFGEYRTTDQALAGVSRTYHETALIPYPKHKVRFVVEARQKDNSLNTLFATEIDPADLGIRKEKRAMGVEVIEALKSGDPHGKVDLAILGEGYTEAERGKFKADLERFVGVMFRQEPYASRKDRFNIYGVLKPSAESGADEPSHGVHKNTTFGTTFDSLGSERYLLTEDNRTLRDVASAVPYDALYVMVNHARYGGGGIYNFYCTFTTDNQWHEYLFIHEFGHSFTGLADEYYTSSTAYNEFYPKGQEPNEPNITALLDPAQLKWKSLVSKGTPVPTPWEKAAYDDIEKGYAKVRQQYIDKAAKLKLEGAPQAEIDAFEAESMKRSRENAAKTDTFLKKSKWWGKVGAYQGAGYASEGLYRPMLDCMMFSRGTKPFCKVCEAAILKVIDHYGE